MMTHTFDSMMEAMGFYRVECKDQNVESVRQKLLDRSNVGIVKYGCTTDQKDLSLIDWLTHLQEELMDASVYLEAAIKNERDRLSNKALK